MEIPGSPSLNTPDALTVEAWIFDKGDGTINHSINKDSATRIWIVRRETDTRVNWHIWNSAGVLRMFTPAGTWAINQWFHFVGTAEVIGGNIEMKVFFNGVLKGTDSFPGTAIAVDTGVPIWIGGHGPWKKQQLIDQVRIYSRALELAQIQKLYAEGAAKRGLTKTYDLDK